MRIKHTLLAAAAISLLSTSSYAVDWGGYTRIGPGQKQASGDGKRCYNGGGWTKTSWPASALKRLVTVVLVVSETSAKPTASSR
jgi:hypothetical protein